MLPVRFEGEFSVSSGLAYYTRLSSLSLVSFFFHLCLNMFMLLRYLKILIKLFHLSASLQCALYHKTLEFAAAFYSIKTTQSSSLFQVKVYVTCLLRCSSDICNCENSFPRDAFFPTYASPISCYVIAPTLSRSHQGTSV